MKLFWATTIALDFGLKNDFYKRAFLYCTILYYTASKKISGGSSHSERVEVGDTYI